MVALLKMPARMTIPMPSAARSTSPSPSLSLAGAERRMFERRETSARVQGKRLDHSLSALRQPSLTLALRDVSLGGLSAISPAPLERGERLTVTFPPQGPTLAGAAPRAGWDAVGRVLRCETSGLGYRIAVEFEAVPAAA